jgi:hypothetical protein
LSPVSTAFLPSRLAMAGSGAVNARSFRRSDVRSALPYSFTVTVTRDGAGGATAVTSVVSASGVVARAENSFIRVRVTVGPGLVTSTGCLSTH